MHIFIQSINIMNTKIYTKYKYNECKNLYIKLYG